MGMLFGGYGAQGVKFKRVKGVYVMTRKRIAVLTAQADEYTQGRFLSGFFEKAFQLDYGYALDRWKKSGQMPESSDC